MSTLLALWMVLGAVFAVIWVCLDVVAAVAGLFLGLGALVCLFLNRKENRK